MSVDLDDYRYALRSVVDVSSLTTIEGGSKALAYGNSLNKRVRVFNATFDYLQATDLQSLVADITGLGYGRKLLFTPNDGESKGEFFVDSNGFTLSCKGYNNSVVTLTLVKFNGV